MKRCSLTELIDKIKNFTLPEIAEYFLESKFGTIVSILNENKIFQILQVHRNSDACDFEGIIRTVKGDGEAYVIEVTKPKEFSGLAVFSPYICNKVVSDTVKLLTNEENLKSDSIVKTAAEAKIALKNLNGPVYDEGCVVKFRLRIGLIAFELEEAKNPRSVFFPQEIL